MKTEIDFKIDQTYPRQSSRRRGKYKENKKARTCHNVEIHVPLQALIVLKVSATTITALTSSARKSTKSVSSQPATTVAAERRENVKPPVSICLSIRGVNLFRGVRSALNADRCPARLKLVSGKRRKKYLQYNLTFVSLR